MIRRHINRKLAYALAAAIERRPALEQFMSIHADRRRFHVTLAQLKDVGIRIETVYDIGAHRGKWTEAARASLPDARFFLFEANSSHESELERSGDRYFIATLSSTERLVDFYAIGGPGDSYYRETTTRYAAVEADQVLATTLDLMIARNHLPQPDLIKADVQGAELDVLLGGKIALTNAKLVLLECPISMYNDGAPTFGEYIRFMEQSGFTPIEFMDPIARAGKVIHIDVLFADLATSRALRS